MHKTVLMNDGVALFAEFGDEIVEFLGLALRTRNIPLKLIPRRED
jgi:hypothetical protein